MRKDCLSHHAEEHSAMEDMMAGHGSGSEARMARGWKWSFTQSRSIGSQKVVGRKSATLPGRPVVASVGTETSE